jgi:hypothetical protein
VQSLGHFCFLSKFQQSQAQEHTGPAPGFA